jgi:mortality factor 4-like protein 1
MAFVQGERVLAFHGPLLHEAVVEKSVARDAPDAKTPVKLHLLRYLGWNSCWDEWVPESRVFKDSHENRVRQKERLKEFQRAHKRKRHPSATSVCKVKSIDSITWMPAFDEVLYNEIREQLRLPHGAKLKLIDDWERVTREKRLVPLPRVPSIATLLDDFVAAKARRTSHERLYGEVCEGVRAYFNQALPTVLLYQYERRQHREIKEARKHEPPVEYYGAEHLLRLLVKMPELLARCHMQREHVTVLVSKLSELLKFLVAHKAKYFTPEYSQAGDNYLRWWQGGE